MRTAIETRLDETEKRVALVETELERERRHRIDVKTQLAHANVRIARFVRAEAALITTVERAETATRSASERETAAKEATVDARRDAQAAREEAEAARRTIVSRNRTLAALRKNAAPKRRKLLVDCAPSQKRARIAAATTHIAKELGANYELVPTKQRVSNAEANALRRAYRLPERTHDVLAKAANLPSLGAVRLWERVLVDACGGIEKTTHQLVDASDDSGTKTISIELQWLSQPRLAFTRYIEQKLRSDWDDTLPEQIELVMVADKGGALTKIGLYVPTGVDEPQSQCNVLLLAAYRGIEKLELMAIAGKAAFNFVNDVIDKNGATLQLNERETFVRIVVLLTADFKMISLMVSTRKRLTERFREKLRGKQELRRIETSQFLYFG